MVGGEQCDQMMTLKVAKIAQSGHTGVESEVLMRLWLRKEKI